MTDENQTILGYGCYHPFRTRAAYQWWTEVSIYLRADRRGRGLGTRLLSKLEQLARIQGYCATGFRRHLPQSCQRASA